LIESYEEKREQDFEDKNTPISDDAPEENELKVIDGMVSIVKNGDIPTLNVFKKYRELLDTAKKIREAPMDEMELLKSEIIEGSVNVLIHRYLNKRNEKKEIEFQVIPNWKFFEMSAYMALMEKYPEQIEYQKRYEYLKKRDKIYYIQPDILIYNEKKPSVSIEVKYSNSWRYIRDRCYQVTSYSKTLKTSINYMIVLPGLDKTRLGTHDGNEHNISIIEFDWAEEIEIS